MELPPPTRAADRDTQPRRVSGSDTLRPTRKRSRSADAENVEVADLDRAAQLAPYRYRDGLEIRTVHRLETEHFKYVGKAAGPVDRARRLTVDVTAISECARLYLEGEGEYWRHSEIPKGDFAEHVGRLERSLHGYWGPALSAAR